MVAAVVALVPGTREELLAVAAVTQEQQEQPERQELVALVETE